MAKYSYSGKIIYTGDGIRDREVPMRKYGCTSFERVIFRPVFGLFFEVQCCQIFNAVHISGIKQGATYT